MIAKLYADQTAVVQTDALRLVGFCCARGTKQGDPLSSLLSNSLSQHTFQNNFPEWSTRKYGYQSSCVERARLTNFICVDDVVIIGGSVTLIKRMISDVRGVVLTLGLKSHPDKLKTSHNFCDRKPNISPEFAVFDDVKIEDWLFSGAHWLRNILADILHSVT
ncbi:unnamed protein product [Prorocentrum cordatum]|uniref:Reverse transcriptase domain-containing protein n=1 Tax=Prorocentrum cordatum TaxID=2364126 RepID=A0ABN9XN01_9DINO|nr:unnamed protein product [Polarella glacialis]